MTNHPDIINTLKEFGGNINIRNSNDQSILHLAAISNK
jgi:ankyrin repeat protein